MHQAEEKEGGIMAAKRILFISGSFGLGHIVRDIAIAKELRKGNPALEISWLATPPASELLQDEGETLLPDAEDYINLNTSAEEVADGTSLNLIKYLMKARSSWSQNVEIFKRIITRDSYDLVIGDETYEISTALKADQKLRKFPYAVIYDFIGLDALTDKFSEKLIAHIWNMKWSKHYNREPYPLDMILFVGELEDIPDTRFGFLLPQRRAYARSRCNFIGYILPFDPGAYQNREDIREEIGYDTSPLVICTIGGTAIGQELLKLCAQSYPIIRQEIPDLKMILVCGPRCSCESISIQEGMEIHNYVPNLYRHFAACDLAIVQAGGTTTLELTALRKPFLYFPIEEHCEQQLHVAGRLSRHGAGIKMSYSNTTPHSLADAVIEHIGKEVVYQDIPTDGAEKAAALLTSRFLQD